jgi:hypothetical protein
MIKPEDRNPLEELDKITSEARHFADCAIRVDDEQGAWKLAEALAAIRDVCNAFDKRLSAIERRIEAEDEYRQEQNSDGLTPQ